MRPASAEVRLGRDRGIPDGDSDPDRALRPWPRYVTARVAADYCDTSPWTIRRHVRPCGRRGRIYIYAIEDVERWMRGQPLVQPSSATPPARVHELGRRTRV